MGKYGLICVVTALVVIGLASIPQSASAAGEISRGFVLGEVLDE